MKRSGRLGKSKGLFFITDELSDIPLEFRSYVKANRDFLAHAKKYEGLFKDVSFAENLLEWIGTCKYTVSEFEILIDRFKEGKIRSFDDFLLDKKELALDFAYSVLDQQPNEVGVYLEQHYAELDKQNDEINKVLDRVYKELSEAGYLMYEYWIDARIFYFS